MNNTIILKFVSTDSAKDLRKLCKELTDYQSIVICGPQKYRPIVADIRDALKLDMFYMMFEGDADELVTLGKWLKATSVKQTIKIL